jgi:tetratricopeptide (TPR) repeat protein
MAVDAETHCLFERNIDRAVKALLAKEYSAAQDYINYAMLEDHNAPEVHNLLGALAELTGDLSLAGKHYRAACALDPAYKPASRNLERVTSLYFRAGDTNPDLGDKPEPEEILPYIIEYDNKNIGHLRKRGKENEKK